MARRSLQKDSTDVKSLENAEVHNGPDVLDVDEEIQQLAKDSDPFYRQPNLLRLYLLIIPGCLVGAVTLGYDAAVMNGLQAVPTWDAYFGEPRGSLLGIMSAILPLGCVLASPFVPIVGDRWGRRMGIFVGSLIMAIGGVIQGAAVNFAMFVISRFIIGVGIVFANAYGPMLIGELAHPEQRQVITSIYQTSWYIGAILAAWTTFATFGIPNDWAWRIPSLLQAAPAIIQLLSVWLLPESPRWLIANKKPEKAKEILVKYHGNDNPDDRLVTLEFKQMRLIIEAEMNNEIGWKTLIATPGNRRRMFIIMCLGCFSQWSGNGLVSYYLVRVLETVGISDARERNIINGCLMIFNWLTSLASAFLTARLKRRTQFMISGFGMLIVFAIQTLCSGLFNERGDDAAGKVVLATLFAYYVFFNLAFNALLYSYPVEILPYPIRAKGFSVLMFFGKAAAFVNILVNPIGLQALSWKFYNVYVGWLVLECFVIWKFFVETKGPSLEAIAALFDKDAVVQHDESLDPVDKDIGRNKTNKKVVL